MGKDTQPVGGASVLRPADGAGAGDALDSIYREHARRVQRRLRRHCPAEEAEDLVSDVFTALRDVLTQGARVEHPWAWLRTTARNLLLNRRRRQRTERAGLAAILQLTREQHRPASATPEDALLAKDRVIEFKTALRSLSVLQRQCLIGRALGLSYQDIGAAFGLTADQTCNRTAKAIAKLQRRLRV